MCSVSMAALVHMVDTRWYTNAFWVVLLLRLLADTGDGDGW